MKTGDAAPGTEPTRLTDIDSFQGYDFLDLGAGTGNQSLASARKRIGGHGLGIDNNPDKVEKAVAYGNNVVLGSALDISQIAGKVSFVVCDNFLEHLPSFHDVDAVLGQAAAVATDFIYIRHPSFEETAYLAELGLKTFWSDWKAHPSMLGLADITAMLRGHGVYTTKIVPVMRIADSADSTILPWDAPPGQHHYRPEHGRKPNPPVVFDRDVFYAFDIVALKPDTTMEMPHLSYKDRLNTEKRPTFHASPAAQHAEQLTHDIRSLRNRKSIRAAEWISRRLRRIGLPRQRNRSRR